MYKFYGSAAVFLKREKFKRGLLKKKTLIL